MLNKNVIAGSYRGYDIQFPTCLIVIFPGISCTYQPSFLEMFQYNSYGQPNIENYLLNSIIKRINIKKREVWKYLSKRCL